MVSCRPQSKALSPIFRRCEIADQEFDVFLSYATEDREWAQMLAERLRGNGVRVWFDDWEVLPGDHGQKKINDGLKHSRKLVAVWTPNYFRDDKVWTRAESYAKQHKDLLARERPLIPVLRLDCDIEPLFRALTYLDCRRDDDFELRFLQLIEALELPKSIISGTGAIVFSRRELGTVIPEQKVFKSDYDVFLCHNNKDKPEVKAIGQKLKEFGILPWLDEWELRPGIDWQQQLEAQIETIRSAAVFVGADGLGPWQDQEQRAFIRQIVKRNCPVIPVILLGCANVPKLPVLLEGNVWVDFRESNPDPIKQLVYGITGQRPK
ncbi:MAG: toll/interleukin-1 receptor domain-containing protein [Acidobacteriota bacterium]|nr:toll/interleukin-1 receptor domain-containing protein [Acidobacteriota bacterium]